MSGSGEHPVGFRKISFGNPRGWRLRIHVWHGEGSESPHCHRWALFGLPLWGSFTDTRWRHTDGSTHRLVTAWPSTSAGGRRYEDTGKRAGLSIRRVYVRRPLRPYLMRYGDIHSAATTGNGRHISLVILAPPRQDTSTVYELT